MRRLIQACRLSSYSSRFCSFSSVPESSTHFGYQQVDESAKKAMVHGVFSSVAEDYDVMNDLMSAGVHRIWKDEFVRMLSLRESITSGVPPPRILDVAGGTGDIAFRILEDIIPVLNAVESEYNGPCITVSDINPNMLQIGKDRAATRFKSQNLGLLEFYQADAENLPFETTSYDAYTISFGLRNVTNISAALKEAYRVLKFGGRFMCLEFSHVSDPLIRKVYDAYSFGVIPKIGELVAKDKAAYKYLVESIRMFPKQQELGSMMKDAGFEFVTHQDMTFGVVSVHSGFKL